MTQHTQVYSSPGTSTLAAPANLIGQTVSAYVRGGTGYNGGTPGTNYCGQVQANVPVTAFPLTVVVGDGGKAASPFLSSTNQTGGNGFSGGGGGGVYGGGGSSAVLSGTLGSYTLLIEAGGGDGFTTLGRGEGSTIPGGGGGGFSSNTPPNGSVYNSLGGGVPVGGPGAGSGGSQGGNGGNSATYGGGSGANYGAKPGGTGFGIVGGGANGNSGSGNVSGAGIGSGGLVLGNAGGCFVASSVQPYSFTYGQILNFVGDPGLVLITYRTVDAPNAPTLVSPTSGQFIDGAFEPQVFSGTYVAPSADTGALESVYLRITQGATVKYWTGATLSSTPTAITPTTGFAAVNGGAFTVDVPAGILSDGLTYSYSFSTVESSAGLQSPYAADVTFQSIVFPTVNITGPTEGQFINSLTPTISWTDTISVGSQTDYRVVLYPTATAPTAPPATTDASAIWDSGLVASAATSVAVPFTSSGWPLPLQSITEYTAFVMIEATGSQPSPWARVDFTIQLLQLPTPTLSVIQTTEPVTGMPAPQLSVTAPDNQMTPVGSGSEGLYVPSSLTNATAVGADTSWSNSGYFSTDITAVASSNMSAYLDLIGAKPGDVCYGMLESHAKTTGRAVALSVAWCNASGGVIRTDALASAGSDSGGVALSGTSSAAPALTAFGKLLVAWTSPAAGETHQIDSIGFFFASPAQWYLGIGLPGSPSGSASNEFAEFQGDYVGDGVFADLITNPTPSYAVDGAGSKSQAYDMGAPFNVPAWYRVRNAVTLAAFTSGGVNYPAQTVVSPWSNVVPIAGIESTQWWIVPPTDTDASMALHRLAATSSSSSSTSMNTPAIPAVPQGMTASFVSDRQEQMGVFRPFGKGTATIVHGDIWDEEFDLNLYFESPNEWENFESIRNLQLVVLLKSDMEGSIYWVTLGPDLNPGIVKQADRQVNPTRGVTVHCVPTDPFIPPAP